MPLIENELAELATMSPAQLRAEWRRLNRGQQVPNGLARSQLERAIAWRLQEKARGGLASSRLRELDRFAKQLAATGEIRVEVTRQFKPGARLVRQWHGKVYVVTATENGFEFEGRPYASLTRIARDITGGAWSGPRFFGIIRADKSAA